MRTRRWRRTVVSKRYIKPDEGQDKEREDNEKGRGGGGDEEEDGGDKDEGQKVG